MATIADVVSILMEYTEDRTITWSKISWCEHERKPLPFGWTTIAGGRRFSVIGRPPQLLTYKNGEQPVQLGQGAEVQELVDLVTLVYAEQIPDPNEALMEKALECLQREKASQTTQR